MGVLICGLNGTGKSTLGRALAAQMGWRFLDMEDYYFPQKEHYTRARSREEVQRLLLADVLQSPDFVLVSVKANFPAEISQRLDTAVIITAPAEIRRQRCYERSMAKFGARMLLGGDLYEQERQFLQMAQSRSEAEVEESLTGLALRVLRVDGTRRIDENAAYLAGKIKTPA